jgi:hypothetical protein
MSPTAVSNIGIDPFAHHPLVELIPAPVGHGPAVGSDDERVSMQLDEMVWKLRREGQTFTGIALALGMSRPSAKASTTISLTF